MKKYDRRIAFYYTFLFHKRIYDPLSKYFEYSLFSNDIDEIEHWHPDVVVVAEAPQIPMLRQYCDLHNYHLVGLRHGVAYKYISPESQYSLTDYICGSQWDVEEFARVNIKPRREFLLTGNPWVDEVFKIPPKKLNKESPTILFAPTWNPETSAAGFFKDKLAALIHSVYPKSKIIIKPHPATLEPEPLYMDHLLDTFRLWVSYWQKIASSNKNVEFIKDPSISIGKFYPKTDILISDGSSLVYEFMALNRPILLYSSKTPIADSNYDPMAISNLWRDVGEEFTDETSFIAALNDVFKNHEENYLQQNRKYIKKLYGNFQDGRSIKRVARAIASLPKVRLFIIGSLMDKNKHNVKKNIHRAIANCDVEFISDIKAEKFHKRPHQQADYILRAQANWTEKMNNGSFIANAITVLNRNKATLAIGYKKRTNIIELENLHQNNLSMQTLLKCLKNTEQTEISHLNCNAPILMKGELLKKAGADLIFSQNILPLQIENVIWQQEAAPIFSQIKNTAFNFFSKKVSTLTKKENAGYRKRLQSKYAHHRLSRPFP